MEIKSVYFLYKNNIGQNIGEELNLVTCELLLIGAEGTCTLPAQLSFDSHAVFLERKVQNVICDEMRSGFFVTSQICSVPK